MLQFNPYAIPLLASLIPLGFILRATWRTRAKTISRALFALVLASGGLIVSYSVELMSADLNSIKWAVRFEYIFHAFVIFWLIFGLVYGGHARWLTRARLIALFIVPAIIMPIVWTNDLHGLIWSRTGTILYNGVVLFDRDYGPVIWVWFIYLYFASFMGSIVLLRAVVRSHALYQAQGTLILISTAIPIIANMLTVMHATPVPDLDLVPYGVALAIVPMALSIFRYRLLEIAPMAHREVIANFPDGVIICDATHRIIDLNPAAEKIIGGRAEAALGVSLTAVLPQIKPLCDAVVKEGIAEDEFELTHEDDTRIYNVVAHRLQQHTPDLSGIVYTLHDVTTRRWAEQRASELALENEKARLLTDFIESTSHDFRTPISALKLNAQVLQRLSGAVQTALIYEEGMLSKDVRDNFAKLDERTQAVEDLSDQLTHLVNGMLELVQLDNRPQYEFVSGDLNGLIAEQIKAMSGRARRKGQTLLQVFAPNLPALPFDSWALGRAINALLDNAHRYSRDGGVIVVRTGMQVKEAVVPEAVITIEDSGIGISSAALPHIFERFYRADPARSASAGAGLGLPIAQAIVAAHGGRIEVESKSGKGSTFRIVLPLNSVPQQKPGKTASMTH